MTVRRRHLLPLGLVALLTLSGCAGLLGGDAVPPARLDAPPAGAETYEWDTDVDVRIAVTANARFRAVYRINRSTRDRLTLFRRDGLGGRNPIPVSAVRYRYANGTVVNGSAFAERGGGVSRSGEEVTVTLPDESAPNATGRLAFSSRSTPKRFSLPTFVDGSYEVVLPENRRVEFPLFGSRHPPGSTVEVVDGRTHVRWQAVEAESVAVRYYLQRDLYIFGGLVAVVLVGGGGGLLYYRRQVERLRERREELGLDVEIDDEFDDDPPPGMG